MTDAEISCELESFVSGNVVHYILEEDDKNNPQYAPDKIPMRCNCGICKGSRFWANNYCMNENSMNLAESGLKEKNIYTTYLGVLKATVDSRLRNLRVEDLPLRARAEAAIITIRMCE
jgi:hypothetical protein